MNRKSSSPPKNSNSIFSHQSKRSWILFVIILALIILVFVFTFESNPFHHDQVRNDEIQNSAQNNNNDDESAFISKIEFQDDDKKFLMNFLLKENIISRETDIHHGHHANDEETVFCLDLVSDANTHFRQLRNLNCENSLKSSLDLIRHHHDQENKKSAIVVAKGNEGENTDNIVSNIIQKEFYDKASPEKDTIEFVSVSHSSAKKKLLNHEKFHSHSKNMKSQAISNFVSPFRTTYEKSFVLALQKIETKSDHDDDVLDDEKHDSEIAAEKRKEVLEFSQAIDNLLILNKTMMMMVNGERRRQYFSSAAYFASLSKIHFVFRISPSITSPLSEGAVHALRDFMLNYDEQVLSHLVKYQKEHHSRVSTNFIFIGLDDENLVKEILKIFFSLIDNNNQDGEKNKESFCRIVTSSNDGKNIKNRNRDVVVVNCGNPNKRKIHSSKSGNDNEGLRLFNEIDPINFCHHNNKKIQLSSSALKFGTKTGVYLGKYSSVIDKVDDHKQQQQLQPSSDDNTMMIVKHYNLLQYVHGFSGGLHNFLSSKISFQHPAIVMPLSACIVVTKEQEKENKNDAKIILPSSSVLITENVLQFQPFIKKQKSLTKFMETVKKNISKKKTTKIKNSDFLSLTWKDKIDISLQLLCIFSFLHSHPRGPFSFDDNHPDQYLIVENQKHNDNNSMSSYYASNAKYLLKMVDIDTLQTAKKIVSGKNNNGDDRIVPPRVGGDGNDNGVHSRRHYSSHALKCRCFYCRGRSNCLFVNSYEGYRSCGQFDGKDRGDEGNRENTKFLTEKMKRKKEKNKKQKNNSNDDDYDDGEIRECTLFTDSWYLGQLLFLIGSDGELLFPTHMSMKEVIEAIEATTKSKEDSSSQDLAEYFPHLSGILKNGDHFSDAENQIRSVFFGIVRELLIERIPPEDAAVKLLGKLQVGSLGLDDWCPNDHFITNDKKIKIEDFEGLRIV